MRGRRRGRGRGSWRGGECEKKKKEGRERRGERREEKRKSEGLFREKSEADGMGWDMGLWDTWKKTHRLFPVEVCVCAADRLSRHVMSPHLFSDHVVGGTTPFFQTTVWAEQSMDSISLSLTHNTACLHSFITLLCMIDRTTQPANAKTALLQLRRSLFYASTPWNRRLMLFTQ